MKKTLIYLTMILSLSACKEQTEDNSAPLNQETLIEVSLPDSAYEQTFSYQKDNLPTQCQSENELVCSIENVVKCALNPELAYCDKQNMPEFLFYDDAMFAGDDIIGRPTEQSFQIRKIKPLTAHEIEVITLGTCDNNWFGVCEGNIIYVMSNKTGSWLVDDVYAIETIK